MIVDVKLKRKLLELVRNGYISPQEAARELRAAGQTEECKSEKTVADVGKASVQQKETSAGREREESGSNSEGIAVIGISGRFPGAKDVDEFWNNLKQGKDCVTEMPKERWDIDRFCSTDKNEKDKTYCKWGGVLRDVDKFDAEFFNISAREAQLMDPQQRLLLQEAWKAIEDAGYSQQALESYQVGVFIGATYSDYARRIDETEDFWAIHTLTGNQISMLAARISYFLNLTGPNLTIDTACSSSLVAISTGCQNLLNHECDMVVAGGVNVMTTPEMYVMTSKGGMLSHTGKCHTFDNEADGFVPGEGVGIVILKRVKDALKDGDHIYGIIKGSKVNQDGKTNGITAPSLMSQHRLECAVYDKYQINPETITYVEAHGTGTKLGDPIEFSALTKSFEKYTSKKKYCSIGAVKANIGHGMISSGAASLIKVLLCLKNKLIVPMANFKQINDLIKIEDSPFYISTECQEWKPDGGIKRRAAISSFGLSGTNCHMVVEEADESNCERSDVDQEFYLLMFSANSPDSLRRNCENIRNYLKTQKVELRDLAYTLSVGRTALPVRTYLIVRDIKDAILKLTELTDKGAAYSDHRDDQSLPDDLIQDQIDHKVKALEESAGSSYDDLEMLAKCFMDAYRVDYYKTLQALKPRRISLPTYSFEEKSYWVDYHRGDKKEDSDTFEFTGNEFFLKGHLVQGEKVLPGVMYLNLVKSCFQRHFSGDAVEIRDIVWMKPYVYGDNHRKIRISWKEAGEIIYFEISSEMEQGETQVHAKCKVRRLTAGKKRIELEKEMAQCRDKESADEVYRLIAERGILYDKTFHVLKVISRGSEHCVSAFRLEEEHPEGYLLHPAIMDGALQTVIAFCKEEKNKTYLPYMIESVQIMKELPKEGYFITDRQKEDRTDAFQIKITDSEGNVAVQIDRYIPRILEDKTQKTEVREKENLHLFEREWVERKAEKKDNTNEFIIIESQKIPESETEYMEYLNHLMTGTKKARHFVIDGTNVPEECGESVNPFWQLIYLAKELMKHHGTGGSQVIFLAKEFSIGQAAAEGVLRTIEVEQPDISCKLVLTDGSVSSEKIIAVEGSGSFADKVVRYREGVRYISRFRKKDADIEEGSIAFQEDGVYLVSGGAGGIGLHIVRHLVKNHKINVAILGRRSMTPEMEKAFSELNQMSGNVEYIQCDIADRRAVFLNVGKLRSKYGRINGVIHSAGVLNDAFIIKKNEEQIRKTFAPKIDGIRNLDQATEFDEMKFFVAFSSIGAISGNVGQCDYAYANSYMDNYIADRARKVQQGLRSGASVSFNWPLWKDGGMQVKENIRNIFREKIGMLPLDAEDGIKVFEYGLHSMEEHVIAISGDDERFLMYLNKIASAKEPMEVSAQDDKILFEKTQDFLRQIIAGVLKIKPEEILSKRSFEHYGIESIMIVSLNEELEKYFGEISKTLFFEYQNLESLTEYFTANQKGKLTEILHLETNGVEKTGKEVSEETVRKECQEETKKACRTEQNASQAENAGDDRKCSRMESRTANRNILSKPIFRADSHRKFRERDIAIIGLNGKYPMAENLEIFWENLREGKDCIEEIPKSRWDYSKRYRSGENPEGAYNSKWGGFLKNVDQFDPLFFLISPKEAEMMDPQERLFLESAWGAVQEAGYSVRELEKHKVGVFAGAMYSHYQLFGAEETLKGRDTGLSSVLASIANRVSYFFNLHGPCMTVDTMCSSSLSALHLACQSIRLGECDMAIAGGVNLSLHENKYILLGTGHFLSNDGRCRSFGEGGTGYVPGEGVGTLLLKPLEQAVNDGDHIYGVIKSTVVNHCGRTNGYSVPSPVEQANLEREAVEESGVPASQIGYIETHGTGTSLGDPIEVNGLTKALGELLPDGTKIPIGSVKSNIGHLESASGMAAIMKVLCMMRHKELVPSLHSKNLNPNINFGQVPFYVQQKTEEWKKPIVDGEEGLRTALISSFGAGGSNAGLVLQEYEECSVDSQEPEEPELLILSAKRETSLKKYAEDMCGYLRRLKENAGSSAADGTDGMEERLKKAIAEVFDVDATDIDTETSLSEMISEPMDGVKICERLNSMFGADLSAEQLLTFESVHDLAKMLGSTGSMEKGLGKEFSRIAHTLQTGRDGYQERLAVIAHNVDDAIRKLEAYVQGKEGDVFYRHLKRLKAEEQSSDEVIRETDRAIAARDYRKLAELWIEGYEIDFEKMYTESPEKIALPMPPLEHKRCWYSSYEAGSSREKDVLGEKPAETRCERSTVREAEALRVNAVVKPVEKPVRASKEELKDTLETEAMNYHGNEVTLKIVDGSIALVTMQDTEHRNQFSKQIIHGLMARFREIRQMNSIKAIIVTGSDNIFCMGGTKEQLNNIYEEKNAFTDVPFLYKGLLKADVPVISAMQGHAFGGGMLFGLYADIVVMSRESVYSAVFTKYGFTPGMGATYILPEKMGSSLATEMMFTAKVYRGEELERRGANVMFADQKDVLDQALYIARQIADKPLHTLEVLKRRLADHILEKLEAHIEEEEQMHRESFSNPEVGERIRHYYIDSEREKLPYESRKISGSGEKKKDTQGKSNTDQEFREKLISALQAHKITPEQAKKLWNFGKEA